MATAAPVQHEAAAFIHEACLQHRTVSLAVSDGGRWTVYQGRLLSFDHDTSRVRITQPEPPHGADPVALHQGAELGVRFVAEDRRVMFMARLYGPHCYYENSQRRDAIEVEIASEVHCTNQRQHFRVRVPKERPMTIILRDASITQRLGETEDPPPTYQAQIRDLSIGGVFVGGLAVDPQWTLEDHLGVELRIPDEDPLLLIAEIRRIAREPDGTPAYGLAFIGAETIRKTFDAQEVLSGVVTDLQRMHLQRRVQGAPS